MIIKIAAFILSFITIGTITVVTTKEETTVTFTSEQNTWVTTSLSPKAVMTIADTTFKNTTVPKKDISLNVVVTVKQKTPITSNEERVCALIDDVCKELGFSDTALIKAMVSCESSFDTTSVSSCNSQGLMQITPRYFKSLMERYEVTDLCKDEVGNLRVGIHWISHLINKYNGDVHKALVAYNCGESVVDNRGVTSNGYSRWVLRTAGDYL